MLVIMAVSFYAWLTALYSLRRVRRLRGGLNAISCSLTGSAFCPAGELIESLFCLDSGGGKGSDAERLVTGYNSWTGFQLNSISAGLARMRTFTAVLPLLGLLGTISGMVTTFTSISSFRASEAGVVSEGIQNALLTTQAGLMTAVPVFVLFHIISALDRKVRIKSRQVEKQLCSISAEPLCRQLGTESEG